MSDPIIQNLERDGSATFHFLDGELDSPAPGPGIEGFYEGPYLNYHKWPRNFNSEDEKTVADAYDILSEFIEEEGPFDGVLGFSHGASLAYGFLAQDTNNNGLCVSGSLFRCAAFFSAIPPFRMNESDQIIYDEGLQRSVNIPTLHVVGREDFVYHHSIKLHAMSDPQWRKLVEHKSGHEIPRDAASVKAVAAGIREMIREASFR